MIYLFLDTNIFIHFKNFEDIPWNQLLNCKKENVKIVIAPTVIDELDKHKYNSNPKVANRIKKIMPKFHQILSDEHYKGLQVKFLTERPNAEIFNEYLLDRLQQDDCLLASIINFKNQLEFEDKIFYATNDFGPKIKANSLNIDVLSIPEEFLIENDLSEEQRLRKENEKLKNLFPKLDIFFKESQKKIYEAKKSIFDVNKQFVIENKLHELKKQFPLLIHTNSSNDNYKFTNLTHDQITSYNKDLNSFFDATEHYWSTVYESVLYDENLVKLNIVIENVGNLPAEDIDIILNFPLDINILLHKDLDYFHIVEPKPPYKPESSFDINHILNKYHAPRSYVSKKKPLSCNKIEFNFSGLKHNKTIEIDTIYVPSQNLKKGFKIDYSILVSNIPNNLKGELNVNFERILQDDEVEE